MHLQFNFLLETFAPRQCLVSLIHVFNKIICFSDYKNPLLLLLGKNNRIDPKLL